MTVQHIALVALFVGLGIACNEGGDARTSANGAETDGGETDQPDDGADDGVDDTGTGSTDEDDDGLEFDPAPAVLPRLTTRQYRNSVEALLGEALPPLNVEPDTNPYLFYSIGATTTTLSELGVQMYEEAAETVATAVFDDATRRAELVGCTPATPGDSCVSEFLSSFGRRAYRRPLTSVEFERWTGIATDLAEGDPWQGLRMAVSGMLQSPNFLYRVELGEPDPEDPTMLRYTGYEMASRLSFLLWNVAPDDELLDAAQAGDLMTTEGLTAHVERMLDGPEARTAVQDFFGQYFDLGRLNGLTRDPTTYPLFSSSLPESMRNEVRLLVDDFVFRRDEDIRKIFSTRTTFVNDDLAELYGVTAPGATAISFVAVELPEDGPRAGMLTSAAFLAMNAHETENSPTLRGKYIRERVLCQPVPPPPDDVDTTIPPDTGEGTTLRERLEAHRENPECAACHAFIDPPGFLFEHFDPIGVYRTEDNGYPIDASGELDGVVLDGAADLAALLGEDPRVGRCVAIQLFRHANGRLEQDGELTAIADIDDRFSARGYRFRELLIELVTHDAFRTVGLPQ